MTAMLNAIKHLLTRLLGAPSDDDVTIHELFEAQQEHQPTEPRESAD